MHIINAEEQHIPAIRRIYAHHVLHGTGSFETAPPNTQEKLARVKNVQSRGFPWYIALQGGGKALLDHALTWARSQGYRQMIAVVGDCANVASVALHLRAGFTEIGTLKDIGFKHGRWLDTVLLQCQLGKGSCTLPDMRQEKGGIAPFRLFQPFPCLIYYFLAIFLSKCAFLRIRKNIQYHFGRAAQTRSQRCHHNRTVNQDRMLKHKID